MVTTKKPQIVSVATLEERDDRRHERAARRSVRVPEWRALLRREKRDMLTPAEKSALTPEERIQYLDWLIASAKRSLREANAIQKRAQAKRAKGRG